MAHANASGKRPIRLLGEGSEGRAGETDEAPGDHLPGRVWTLAEHDVGREHADRADGEAGQRPERVTDDEGDRGDRLDVGQRHERVAAERRDGGERGHDRDHARRGPPALIGDPAGSQDQPDDQRGGEQPAHRASP